LSPSANADDVSTKRKQTDDDDDDDDDDEQIPYYLFVSNELFMNRLGQVINTASSIDLEDLRQIAIFKHNIAAVRIQKQVVLTYLRAGTGKMKEPTTEWAHVDQRIWPKQVKSEVLKQQYASSHQRWSELNAEDEHQAYVNFVHQRLQEIDEKLQRYERQLTDKKRQIIGFTSELEEGIDAFVQQHGIQPLQMKLTLKMELIKHDYEAELLVRRFLHENPNEYQVE
jgi:hypothetical protein